MTPMLAFVECPACHGEGKNWASRHGGNDPDVWSVFCETCEGLGVVEVDLNDEADDEDEGPADDL